MRKSILNQASFSADELSKIKGGFVCRLTEGVDDDGYEIIFITLFNPITEKYVDVEFGEHGLVFISDVYGRE